MHVPLSRSVRQHSVASILNQRRAEYSLSHLCLSYGTQQAGAASYTSLDGMDRCSFKTSTNKGDNLLPEFVVENHIPTISVSSNLYDAGATCGMCIYVTPTGSSTRTKAPATNFASTAPFFAFVTHEIPSIGGSDFEIDQIGRVLG